VFVCILCDTSGFANSLVAHFRISAASKYPIKDNPLCDNSYEARREGIELMVGRILMQKGTAFHVFRFAPL
jgi:hypothetical protein